MQFGLSHHVAIGRLLPLLFIIALMLVFANPVLAQTYRWSQRFGNTSVDQGLAVCVDGNGNVFITGRGSRTTSNR